MARKLSGFLPQNQTVMEEWELLEECEAQSRMLNAWQAQQHEPPPLPQERPPENLRKTK